MIISFIRVHSLSMIWFIFTALFFFVAWQEWRKSKKDLESLGTIRPNTAGKVIILGVDFTSAFGLFKDAINKSNKESHRMAATAYFLAGLTAPISFIVSLL